MLGSATCCMQVRFVHNVSAFSLHQALKLDSPQNAKLAVMASNIGIPSAPVLRVVSESFSLVSLQQENHHV